MESCLAAQNVLCCLKSQDPLKKLKNWRKCIVLQAYRLIPLTRPLSGHFTFGIIIFVKLSDLKNYAFARLGLGLGEGS
jgi:hypothetical protein